MELLLPGLLRWLQEVKADAIMYCPLLNGASAYAGKVLGIPSVALLTLAGPGSMAHLVKELLAASNLTEEKMLTIVDTYQPHLEAVRRLNEKYTLMLGRREGYEPIGYLAPLQHSVVTLVTTSEDLQDPTPPEVERAYQERGVAFEAVGPLLDKEGSRRSAGHKFHREGTEEAKAAGASAVSGDEALAASRAARSAGRAVVLVSMGTVITGDSEDFGWEGRTKGPDGTRRGLTGRELCRGAWGGAFDALGRQNADEGPLLVVALGPQPDALGPLKLPANAVCSPALPQVDILKAGVDLFLTHGGQNSFTEAMATGTSLVVCPGFGDQPVNARKAEALGVGLQVARPEPEVGMEIPAAEQYRAEVARVMGQVFSGATFRSAAARVRERMQLAGGVPRAVEVMVTAADAGRQCDQASKAQVASSGLSGRAARPHYAGA